MQIDQEEALFEKVVRGVREIICILDPQGSIVNVSGGSLALIGLDPDTLVGKNFALAFQASSPTPIADLLQQAAAGQEADLVEIPFVLKTDREIIIQWSVSWAPVEQLFALIGRDITRTKLSAAEQCENHLYQVMVKHGSDMVAIINEEGNYVFVGGSSAALTSLGFTPEQLVGQNVFQFIHPEDISRLEEVFALVLESTEPVTVADFRFQCGNGNWRWLETTIINQLHNPGIKGIIATSHDITNRVNNQLRLEEGEERFKALFEKHPDIVIFENPEGIILDANPVLLKTFNVKKQELIGLSIKTLLPPEAHPACDARLTQALAGEDVNFKLTLQVPESGERVMDITKIPVAIRGEVVGVFTIAKDITESNKYVTTIQRQARKLNTIFESITDAFFTLSSDWKFTYINAEFDRILGTDRTQLMGKNIFEMDPNQVLQDYLEPLKRALATGETGHFEVHLKHKAQWLEVKVYPSEEGLSIYFIDVTDRVNGRLELEKLSLVASKTINGIIFLNAAEEVEWVNEGFTNLTGFSAAEVLGRNPAGFLEGPETDPKVFERIREQFHSNIAFQEEVLNYTRHGKKVWLALDFTPILDNNGRLTRYIVMQNDITYRKEAEAAQLQLTDDLYRQNRDMQQFTYIVSHNLRAPVANALGYAEFLTVANRAETDYDQYLSNLQASILELDQVLKDLNIILSIRDKGSDPALEEVFLEAKCRQAIGNFQESLDGCGATITLHFQPNLKVLGNKIYLHSIFFNLISNAIKYRSPDRPLHITIRARTHPNRGTLITFSDNGSGFDQEKAGSHIFKLYKRFHKKVEGRGIGLFLIKSHLEAMGGQIEVSSKVNTGTRFLIFLK